jgi:hypothetical protein
MAAGILTGCQWELNSFLTAILIKIHVLVIFLEEPFYTVHRHIFQSGVITTKRLTQPLLRPGALLEAFLRKILP